MSLRKSISCYPAMQQLKLVALIESKHACPNGGMWNEICERSSALSFPGDALSITAKIRIRVDNVAFPSPLSAIVYFAYEKSAKSTVDIACTEHRQLVSFIEKNKRIAPTRLRWLVWERETGKTLFLLSLEDYLNQTYSTRLKNSPHTLTGHRHDYWTNPYSNVSSHIPRSCFRLL
jgi:hypothetical protein